MWHNKNLFTTYRLPGFKHDTKYEMYDASSEYNFQDNLKDLFF